MRDDFKTALARVQGDYSFYIQCQSNPEAALAEYSLSPEERAALNDPERLGDWLKRGTGVRLPSIIIKISGTHDWINRAAPPEKKSEVDDLIAREVESIRRAGDDDERGESTLRLIRLLG